MIRFLLFLVLLSPLTAQHAVLGSLDAELALDAIQIVENTSGWGRHGEYGPWQMSKLVRRAVGGHDRAAAYRWLIIVCQDLRAQNADVNIHSVALSWNAGVRKATSGRAPESSYDYALRASNVYFFLLSQRHPAPIVAKPVHFSLNPPMFTVSFKP